MTKKTINLGSVVDDSTGDYLRQGGIKINENFEDAYSNLGDGTEFHPAGAWKTHTFANGSSFTPVFGKQYNINTLGGSVSITLPKGSAADYGRVIKLRDVHASWGTNSVTIKPTSGDSLGGSTNPVVFNGDFTTLEFVYSSPATWRYVSNMKLDSLPKTSGAGVIVKTFKVTASAFADGYFTNISATGYNTSAVQVYRNGTLLTYDPTSNFANSDYGSKSGTSMAVLNGVDIYIPYVVNGDVVTVISYTKDVTAAPVSYVRYDVQMIDSNWNPQTPVAGQSMLVKSNGTYTLTDLGRPSDEEFNPNAFQLLINGTLLVESGKANLSASGDEDYTLKTDASGKWNTFTISPVLSNEDVLTVVYFNNELGSILEWDGVDGIKTRASQIFLNTEYRFNRSNKIRYTNTANPSATTAAVVPGSETNIRFENVVQLLESIYPVGSIYINANNAANPATYMGFGQWAAYAKGRAVFGFDGTLDAQGNPDPLFGINTAALDADGNPLKVAGNQIGERQIELTKENIPQLESSIEFMKSGGASGDINLSGCVPMPGGETAPLATYELEKVQVNAPAVAGQKPADITIIPPGITAYMWVRVA
jgi:hypothetical protein